MANLPKQNKPSHCAAASYRPPHRAVIGHPFRTILAYNRPYWREYLIGALLSALFVVIGLSLPLILRAVVARFQNSTMTTGLLALYFIGLLAIAVTTGFARYWERTLIIGASRKCEYALRNDFFRHVQSLSQEFFHRTQSGDLLARATNDLNYVRMFIGPGIMGTIDMMRVPLTLAVMFYLSPYLTLLALMPLPLVSVLVYVFVTYMHRQSQRVQDQYSVVTSRVQENLAGARVVQAYGIADREIASFRIESDKYMRENVKLASVMSFAWPLIGFVVGLMILFVLWRGGYMVIDDQIKLADLTGFVVCMLLLVWPLAEFGWILTLYQRGAVGMNRMNEIFAEVPKVREDENTIPDFTIQEGAIRFENVAFTYASPHSSHPSDPSDPSDLSGLSDPSQSAPALASLNFEILPGQTVAIVGPTGSGKTTLVSLLTREFDPTQGRVLIDGMDARRIPLTALRGSIGYVLQDTFLFSDSVRDNIMFGRPEATREEIDHACEVARFSETVAALPDGYDTLLGERGVNLSGGQKQRLAIARAVIRDPKILILDDALSSVDTQTEEYILTRLKEVMATRTSIIISHRISTVQDAGLILVMNQGRIVERGGHAALLVQGGLYKSLYERQLLEQELEMA